MRIWGSGRRGSYRWGAAVVGVFLWLSGFGMVGPGQFAQHAQAASNKGVDLQQMLEKGLRARRPSEFAFLQRVVAQVETGDLPPSLVRSTFNWARNKRPYPFPYFERALKQRAGRLGLIVR